MPYLARSCVSEAEKFGRCPACGGSKVGHRHVSPEAFARVVFNIHHQSVATFECYPKCYYGFVISIGMLRRAYGDIQGGNSTVRHTR